MELIDFVHFREKVAGENFREWLHVPLLSFAR